VSLRFFTHDERPELADRKGPLLDAWPLFMLEDDVSNRCWGLLYEKFGGFQHFLVAEDDELVAEVNSVPVELDVGALPERGWDEALERGTTGTGTPTVVSAIQVLIAPGRQGQGLSKVCLERMRETAGAHGFEHLVAPVRPSLKDRYPLSPSSATSAGRDQTDGSSTRGCGCTPGSARSSSGRAASR
jgi:GNAT superfamily N-acetyltransferase